MNPTTESLSFAQSMWVSTWVALWVLLVVALLPYIPNNSTISPALSLHLSATLVLLLMIKRLGGQIADSLFFYATKLQWLLLAIVVGVAYWFIDHWMMDGLFNTNNADSIKSWQQANASYHFLSVFISSVIMAPLFEELFFRGLIFRGVLKRYNFVIAALISALLFALIHWSWPEFFSLLLVGLIYALLAHKSNSVITPVIAHMVHNLMTYVYFTQ